MITKTSMTIFWPMIAQVAVTFTVWLRLYHVRTKEMASKRLSPQIIATRHTASALQDTSASDNLRNLFELPVLFYVICCMLAIADAVSTLQLALAWSFVLLRATHSFIHVTYNRVMHRFLAYSLGGFCMFAMWAVFVFWLIQNG